MPRRTPRQVHLALDLSDAGARPGAWRTLGSRAPRLYDEAELARLVATAARGALDLVVLDDSFTLAPGRSTTVGGRLDAAVVAARLGAMVDGIGLVAAVATDVAAPVEIAWTLGTIDRASAGRAGWQVSTGSGRPGWTGTDDLTTGSRTVTAVRDAWESWDEHAASRPALGHLTRPDRAYVERDGVHFAPRGRRATPAPLQGRPPVIVRAHSTAALEAAGALADVVRIRAPDAASAAEQRARVRAAADAAGRTPDDVLVLVDAYTVIGPDAASAGARRDLLVAVEGVTWDEASLTHVGTADALTSLILDWVGGGAADGLTCRPSSLRTDVHGVVDGVVPGLRDRGVHRRAYPGTTLRETLGLTLPGRRAAASG